jgi:hypothetical protein
MRPPTLAAGSCAALLLITVGALLYVELPKLVHKTIDSTFTMTGPESAMYPTFFDSARHNVFEYKANYFFNITNAADVTAGRAYPVVEQVGPYVYREFESRPEEYTQWHANGTVRFKQHTVYLFEPSMSKGTESDVIVTADMGMLTAVKKLNGGASAKMQKEMQYLFSPGLTYFVAKNVSEMLYGWEFLGKAMVAMQPDDKNDISAKPFHAMYTGGKASATQPAAPARAYGKVTEWRGMTAMPGYWNSSYANMINGTDGSSLAPGVARDGTEYLFVSTLYRSIPMRVAKVFDYHGITLYRFVADTAVFQTPAVVPENSDFYITTRGFLVSPPALRLPTILSKAKFLDCDQSAIKTTLLGGGKWATDADRDELDIRLDFEPMTGSLFRVRKPLQVNVDIGPIRTTIDDKDWKIGQHIRPTLLPVLLVFQTVTLNDHDIAAFKSKILFPLALATYLGVTLIVLGCVLFVATPLLGHVCCRHTMVTGDVEDKTIGSHRSALSQHLQLDSFALRSD